MHGFFIGINFFIVQSMSGKWRKRIHANFWLEKSNRKRLYIVTFTWFTNDFCMHSFPLSSKYSVLRMGSSGSFRKMYIGRGILHFSAIYPGHPWYLTPGQASVKPTDSAHSPLAHGQRKFSRFFAYPWTIYPPFGVYEHFLEEPNFIVWFCTLFYSLILFWLSFSF